MTTEKRITTAAALALCLAVLPAREAPALVSAAQAAKILAVVNEVNSKTNAIKGEVDGLNDLTRDSNVYLARIVELNTGAGALLKTINDTQIANHQHLMEGLKTFTAAASGAAGNAALAGDAYSSRAGHSSVDVANAQSGCGRGWSARLAGNAAAIPKADGGVTSVAAEVAQEFAHTVGERQAENTLAYGRALFAVPDAMKTGAQYSAAAAFAEADLKRVKELHWLEAPKPPADTPREMAYDGVQYGLARQVLAHWYAGLAPLSKGYEISRNLAARYPAEALPVVWQDGDPLVPAHGLLRAEALSPWYDAAPMDPAFSYGGWLLSLDQAGLARENARLMVINNRLLYEQLLYDRWDALLAAQAALRR